MRVLVVLVIFSAFLILQSLPRSVGAETGSSDDYYSSVYKLYGPTLRLALHNLIKGHTTVTYSPGLWNAFPSTDAKPNGKVWDMYSDVPSGTPAYEFTFVTQQCGNYNSEADCYNREHSWPSSWFSDTSPAHENLFHLYTTDGYVNNRRANYPYGNVSVSSWTSTNGGKLGANTSAGYSGTVFEPINAYKGDLARSHFYTSVRYYTEDILWSTSPGTNKSDILDWYADMLFSWHILDSVSVKEINRNTAVAAIQNNRNPFIDHPEFVAEIRKTAMAPTLISATRTSPTTILLDFSRYLDSSFACVTSSFVVGGGIGNPAAIQWGANNDVSKIVLTTPALSPGNNYSLQITNQKSINGVAMRDTSVPVLGTTRVVAEELDPTAFVLEQNFPNPFNPETSIRFQLSTKCFVSLKIFNLLGQAVATLVNEEMLPGTHVVSWQTSGNPAGVCFYRFAGMGRVETKRLLFLK